MHQLQCDFRLLQGLGEAVTNSGAAALELCGLHVRTVCVQNVRIGRSLGCARA
ncbi:hypothetical protein [Lysobacter gummosus]|uniref:hypothetical protein n=1 Tax=Lysobacter gummosus TaxID=262324 RepID=UPI00362F0735